MRRLRLMRMILAAGAPLMLAGCGGQFVMYAPDPVAPVGQQAPVVVRLQRLDVFYVPAPVKDTCVRFRLPDSEQAAFTDKEGYAGVGLRAPQRPGNYALRVEVQAKEGEEVTELRRFYVWTRERPVIAIDYDSLPSWGMPQWQSARSALGKLSTRMNILYMTERPVSEHGHAHWSLMQRGYPDGPVLLWQSQRWQILNRGGMQVPEVLWQGKLVSQLPLLRDQFPALNAGVTTSPRAAAAFRQARLRSVIVGGAYVPDNYHVRCRTWADVANVGL